MSTKSCCDYFKNFTYEQINGFVKGDATMFKINNISQAPCFNVFVEKKEA